MTSRHKCIFRLFISNYKEVFFCFFSWEFSAINSEIRIHLSLDCGFWMPGAGERLDYLSVWTSSGGFPTYLERVSSRPSHRKCVLWVMYRRDLQAVLVSWSCNSAHYSLLCLSSHSHTHLFIHSSSMHGRFIDTGIALIIKTDIVPAAGQLTMLRGDRHLNKQLQCKMSKSQLLLVLFLPLPFLLHLHYIFSPIPLPHSSQIQCNI